MKKLFLLRHANTQPNTGGDDKHRILTPKGVKEIKALADKIDQKNAFFDFVICSTAERTKQTSQYLENFLEHNFNIYYTDELYNPTLEDYISCIQNLDDQYDNVLVISHNPATSDVANHLLNLHNISFNTANLASLELNIDSWQETYPGCAKLKWFIS